MARRLTTNLWASLVVGLLGGILLLQPIGGDQALAILIARRLQDGAVIYRDVWDIRQPLTFVWYPTVGSLFGSGLIAVRLGEILWQGTLALLIARDVTERTGSRQCGVITSIAGVAPIFWIMQSNDVAQPDTLMLLPIYVAFRVVTKAAGMPLRPLAAGFTRRPEQSWDFSRSSMHRFRLFYCSFT